MIHATELRIGNWIILDWDGSKSIQQIDGINLYDCNEPRVWFREWDDFALSCIDSIPLTPEILETCGFKYNKIEGVARISDDFEEPEGNTEYWELGKMTIVSWDKGPLTLSNKSSFDHRIELTSLHQLQNLYFALTGTELEFKPTTLQP